MTKLSDKTNIRLRAIVSLVKQYWQDPDFKKEFDQVCQHYEPLIKGFTAEFLLTHKNAVALPSADVEKIIDTLRNECTSILGSDTLSDNEALQTLLSSCFSEMKKIAYKWKFKIPEVGLLLFLAKVTDVATTGGVKMVLGPDFHPTISVEIPPLEFGKIQPWTFFAMSQTDILSTLGKKLSDYAHLLQEAGLKKYPYKLDKHAYWWFQAIVQDKTWEELADEEAQYDEDGGPHKENIKKAVILFSSLVGIKTSSS